MSLIALHNIAWFHFPSFYGTVRKSSGSTLAGTFKVRSVERRNYWAAIIRNRLQIFRKYTDRFRKIYRNLSVTERNTSVNKRNFRLILRNRSVNIRQVSVNKRTDSVKYYGISPFTYGNLSVRWRINGARECPSIYGTDFISSGKCAAGTFSVYLRKNF